MKQSLEEDIITAWAFMPNSIDKDTNLDLAIDNFRSWSNQLNANSFDLVMMGYRYSSLFNQYLIHFNSGEIKPKSLIDLWLIFFSASLSRDRIKDPSFGNLIVEISKTKLGEKTTSLTNAFVRSIEKNRELIDQLLDDPKTILSESFINQNIIPDPKSLSKSILSRPVPGIQGFDKDLNHITLDISELSEISNFQAMNIGSFNFSSWSIEKIFNYIKKNDLKEISLLDACAAPGAKLIKSYLDIKSKFTISKCTATEAKNKRFKILNENLKNWSLENNIDTEIYTWGKNHENPAMKNSFNVILADLPCSGSGTVQTRPDILNKNLDYPQTKKLVQLQTDIVNELINTFHNSLFLFSICSMNKFEINNLNNLLAIKPSFQSTLVEHKTTDIITGWEYCN